MNAIQEQRIKLQDIIDDMRDIVRKAAISESEFIAELNQMQLSEGMTEEGDFLPPYSQTSVSVFGKPPGPIRLFDKGDFYKGIKPVFEETGIDMVGLDQKTPILTKKYSRFGNILGINNEESKRLLSDRLKPKIIEEIRKRL